MGQLWNKTRNAKIFDNLQIADSAIKRMRGLLGRSELQDREGLLILGDKLLPANSIHTLFMKFAIDLVFLDKEFRVVAVKKNVKPWRICAPVVGAWHVLEGSAGTVERHRIEIGDVLNVVS